MSCRGGASLHRWSYGVALEVGTRFRCLCVRQHRAPCSHDFRRYRGLSKGDDSGRTRRPTCAGVCTPSPEVVRLRLCPPLQAIQAGYIGLPPFRLVSPETSTRVATAHMFLWELLHVANISLFLHTAVDVDTLEKCTGMSLFWSIVNGVLGLLGIASNVMVAVLWIKGPPTYDRRDKSDQKKQVMVDFLEPQDLGDGELASRLRMAGVTVGMCHCPGLAVHQTCGPDRVRKPRLKQPGNPVEDSKPLLQQPGNPVGGGGHPHDAGRVRAHGGAGLHQCSARKRHGVSALS
eukprot:74799-Prorocentrum_minimum.AAC.1